MGKILVKNSFTAASVPAGLSAGELAVNVIDKKLFVGNAVGGVVTLVDPNALVTSVNGLTGAVQGVSTAPGGTYNSIQYNNAGVLDGTANAYVNDTVLYSPTFETTSITNTTGLALTIGVVDSGNLTMFTEDGNILLQSSGTVSITGTEFTINPVTSINMAGGVLYIDDTNNRVGINTITPAYPLDIIGVTQFRTGLSAAGGTFSGNISAPNIVNSFNGLTGAVTGITAGGANTFTALQTFSAGISASGATFSAPITSTRMARHTSAAISAQKTVDFTPTTAEDGTVFYINYSGKGSVTVTFDSLPIGWRAKFLNVGSGAVYYESTGDIYGEGSVNSSATWLMEAICIDTNTYFIG